MALIAASFPYKAQLDEFKNRLFLPDYQSVLKESSRLLDEKRQPLPAFRFLGVRLQRRVVDAMGKPLASKTPEGWEPVDLAKDYKPYLFATGNTFEPDRLDVASVSVPGLVMPRLVQVRKDQYPEIETNLKNIRTTLEEMARAKDVTLPTHCLVRLIDVTIKPGTIYEYRIQVRLANPNYRRSDKANPQNAPGEELDSDKWYDIPQKVVVPPEMVYYAVDQKDLENRVDGKNNYQGIHATERLAKDQQVAFQIHRWVDTIDNGRSFIGEWAVAERIIVTRGEYIGRTVRVEVPVWNYSLDAFEIPQTAKGKQKLPGVEVNFGDSRNEAVLVDFEGPDHEYKRGTTTLREHTTTEVVIFSSDGKLLARETKSDEKNEIRQERLKEWRNRVKEVKDSKPDAPKNPKGPVPFDKGN